VPLTLWILIGGIEHTWKQFRFRVGAPDAEAKFETAIAEAQKTDRNARKYPSLYVRRNECTLHALIDGCLGIPWIALEKLALSVFTCFNRV